MAVDPATAKAIARAAAKILSDEDARNRLLYRIFGGIAVSVVVLLMPLYLLTHPFEMLKAAFADTPDDAAFIERYKQENDDKVQVTGGRLVFEGVYPLPVTGASITSEYGGRIDPITGEAEEFHYGTDFGGEWRSEIYAIADGEVVYTCTEYSSYGNHIIIKHDGKRINKSGGAENETFYTMYAHLNEVRVDVVQTVAQGAVIGLMGGDPSRDENPGSSTGTHLHFEIRKSQWEKGISPDGYIFPENGG